jgi:hypothetical protein
MLTSESWHAKPLRHYGPNARLQGTVRQEALIVTYRCSVDTLLTTPHASDRVLEVELRMQCPASAADS